MKEIKDHFENLLAETEIEAEEDKIEKMLRFLEFLYEKNKVMNLTAIRDKKEIMEKHFIDSLLLTKIIKEDEKKFIDVGTGAGFPGLVLSIYYPEKEFLLVDSVRKKVEFINEVI
ncbi:MAG: 16S rRNA (guanine(527)-N(7))-methyltransferase RsmG, partial [Pseudoleptotrichia goodfellowii]|nr:16S rRNA (guanine(527)-N(7))-methyltransferase RsmG [Pseudoleptotrichia goodfellowii]